MRNGLSKPKLRAERSLWGGTAVGSIGDGVRLAALPLLLTAITKDPLLVSMLTVVQRVPPVIFALPVGVLLDRFDGLNIWRRSQILRVVGVVVILVASVYGPSSPTIWLPAIYVAAAFLGAVETVSDIAAQTVVQQLIDRGRLEHVNSRVVAGQMVGEEFVGPAVGGILFGVTRWLPFSLVGVAYIVQTIVLGSRSLKTLNREVRAALPTGTSGAVESSEHQQPTHQQTTTSRSAMWRDIGDGCLLLVRSPKLLIQAIWGGTINAANGAITAVFVLFAVQSIHLSTAEYGIALIGSGIGGLLGALASEHIGKALARLMQMFLAGATAACLTVLLGFTNSLVGVLLVQAALGFCGVSFSVVARSYRQAVTPNEFAGRITSVYRLINLGAVPGGALVGGLLAS